ncbi:sulfatase-like hydrolase/transferase [Nitrosopumilus sp.]|jgi:arylsulfatase A-like enzyme|nr:sulfatase-like hydrolase/transferase [Nitrosopumilus sp.]
MMNQKNIIIIMVDGGRLDRAQNSNIFKKLKSKSIFFSNSITYGPHTIAAMHAVFSGSYGSRTGTNSYWSTFKFKKNKFKTLTEYLKTKNYTTHADVINQLVVPKQGFDNYVVHDESKDDLVKRHKILLEEMNQKKSNNNFFLYLHYSKIHTGIMNEVLKIYDNYSNDFFSNKEKNESRYDNLFQTAESYLDEILIKISQLELDKNSIILVMSDHGISVGEKLGERAYGAYCYDYTIRNFAYFLVPDSNPLEIKQQIRTIDYMPTILDFLNISLDKSYSNLDGISLLPLIKGKSISEPYAFSETGNPLKDKAPPKEPNTKSIRTSKWKLIFNEYNNTKELYNLQLDPNENNNLIGTGEKIEKKLWAELQNLINKRD